MKKRRPVSYTLDADLLDRLESWIEAQEVKPSRVAVIEAALRAFLDSRERKR
jgi:metal-responsive CopG/Arc/MetJ family transcriptional regulator